MLAFDGLVGLALFVLWLYCIFDAVTTDATLVRNLPKGFWILLVIMLPDVGSILWLVAGRPRAQARPGGLPYKGNAGRTARPAVQQPRAHGRGSVAPDDDPEFLARLDCETLRRWEDDLRRREERLRGQEEPPGDERP